MATMSIQDFQRARDAKRKEEMDGDPELRGYYKVKELADQNITILEPLQYGESSFTNSDGKHDPYVDVLAEFHVGALGTVRRKLRIGAKILFSVLNDWWEENPKAPVQCRMVMGKPYDGASFDAWVFRDWSGSMTTGPNGGAVQPAAPATPDPLPFGADDGTAGRVPAEHIPQSTDVPF